MSKKTKKQYTEQRTVEQIESTETFNHDLFTIVNHNGEFLIAIGNNVVTRAKFRSREEAETYIDSKPWELIFNACAVMVTNLFNQTNNK